MTTARLEIDGEPPDDDSAKVVRGAMTRLALVRDISDRGLPFKRWKLAATEGRRLAQSAISGAVDKNETPEPDPIAGTEGPIFEQPVPDVPAGAELMERVVVDESARL